MKLHTLLAVSLLSLMFPVLLAAAWGAMLPVTLWLAAVLALLYAASEPDPRYAVRNHR
jgi:hypothetical protein